MCARVHVYFQLGRPLCRVLIRIIGAVYNTYVAKNKQFILRRAQVKVYPLGK